MDPAALAGLCLLLNRGDPAQMHVAGVACPSTPVAVIQPPAGVDLRGLTRSPDARDAIARVAYAEAGNQGDSGLAAVVYTILNRLQDGRWGGSVGAVLNAPSQFEPVMRAGGDWRNLPARSPAAQARIDTILNLALDGRLPDLTNGARFFQNPAIVANRAQAGQVSAGLVNFRGTPPSAVIGAHSFYREAGRGGGAAARRVGAVVARGSASQTTLIVGENRSSGPAQITASQASVGPRAGDPSRGLFVGSDGQVRDAQP